MKVTYRPTDPADTVTEAFGQVVEAGTSIDVTNEAYLAKLRGNPEFEVAGEKDQPEDRRKDDEALAKIVDGRSKAAREARAKADEVGHDAAVKERAAAQVRAIAEARADKDRD